MVVVLALMALMAVSYVLFYSLVTQAQPKVCMRWQTEGLFYDSKRTEYKTVTKCLEVR